MFIAFFVIPGRRSSYQLNTRNRLKLSFKASLPDENKEVKKIASGKRFVSSYASIPPKMADKLTALAKKLKVTESEALRKILDKYFKDIEKKGLPYEPLRKTPPVGLKMIPRTIGREQAIKLRELSRKTGRKMSELIREAVEMRVDYILKDMES